jgi:hypothetical protein
MATDLEKLKSELMALPIESRAWELKGMLNGAGLWGFDWVALFMYHSCMSHKQVRGIK